MGSSITLKVQLCFLAIFTLNSLLCSADCDNEDGRIKRYYTYTAPASWAGALRACIAKGQRLATITSPKESALLQAVITQANVAVGPWWVGGSDDYDEGNWFWMSANQFVGFGSGYTNWKAPNPDNAGGDENCLEVGRWGGVQWNDAPCTLPQRYICEGFRKPDEGQ